MSDHSSAPRLPLSPASPPESGLKLHTKAHIPATALRTPPSTDQMSVATKRYVPFSQDGRHTNEMATRSSNDYLTEPQRSPSTSLPTQSSNNLKRSLSQDDEKQPPSKRQRMEEAGGVMDTGSFHVATNHDRDRSEQPKQPYGNPTEVSFDDTPIFQDIPHVDRAKLDSTFKDVGTALLTRKTTHRRAAVNVNDNLLGKYGLHSILSSVARIDPATGEKANRLRKSYEGQIKSAGLSGRNRPYKEPRADDEPSKLMKMAIIPEAEFNGSQVGTKPVDLQRLQETMKNALQLNSGNMNKSITADWDDILGHEVKKPAPQTQAQPTLKGKLPRPSNGVQHQQAIQAADKVKTRGRKRDYNDASYEGYQGYGEGYSDPENASDGDKDYNDRGRKRRKE